MRSPRRRVSLAAAAGLAAVLLAAGCSSSGSSTASSSASPSASALEQSHISVGALPVVDDAGLYLAWPRSSDTSSRRA